MQISLITICYNARATIAATFASVLAQEFSDIEYIIVDGDSSDGTRGVIEEYLGALRKRCARVVYVSEADAGIYYAMNKGIALASGQVVGFLNADDEFYDSRALLRVASAFGYGGGKNDSTTQDAQSIESKLIQPEIAQDIELETHSTKTHSAIQSIELELIQSKLPRQEDHLASAQGVGLETHSTAQSIESRIDLATQVDKSVESKSKLMTKPAPKPDAICGKLALVDKDGQVLREFLDAPKSFSTGYHPAHPTFYMRREIIQRHPFDTRYKIASDYDLMYYYCEVLGIELVFIPHLLVKMRADGASNAGPRAIYAANKEVYASLRRHGVRRIPALQIVLRKLRAKIEQKIAARDGQNNSQ